MGKLQQLHERAKKMAYSEELQQYEGFALKADNSFEFGYMVGAHQQAEIEIDKAREWLKAHYKDIYWEVESPTRRGDIGEYLAEDFRNAMEEEL